MPNSKIPKIILEFEPDPNFEEEFLEFIETVLSWTTEKTKKEDIKDESAPFFNSEHKAIEQKSGFNATHKLPT